MGISRKATLAASILWNESEFYDSPLLMRRSGVALHGAAMMVEGDDEAYLEWLSETAHHLEYAAAGMEVV